MPEVNGETHIRAGYFTDGAIMCVKVANFFFDNPRAGLPTLDCAVVVSDRRTGRLLAVICDGGLLSDMRTAAASAVAARALARDDASTLGLIGAGNQAYWHALALRHVRRIASVKVWSRSAERTAATAERISAATGVPAAAAALEAAALCDIVVTATPARSAILETQRTSKGACVIAMGADTPGKRELGPGFMSRATWIVADNLANAQRAGELQWLPDAGNDSRVAALGAVLAGEARRPAAADLVVYDSTGIAFQDVVAASLVLEHGRVTA
jgi:ornithine cyclodeaminase